MGEETLRFVTATGIEPLVFVNPTPGGGTTYSGYLIDLLGPLLAAANITAPWELYVLKGASGGTLQANGSWSGVMGELVSRRANMSVFPLTLTATREPFIDSTLPFIDAGYAMLIQVHTVDASYSFLKPFSGGTWGAILGALLFTALLLLVLDSATRWARIDASERVDGVEHAARKHKKSRVMDHLLETVMMAVGSGSAPTASSWAPRVLFITWAFFCVIFLAAYTSNLTATLTVAQLGTSISSLVDLQRSGGLFGVPAGSSIVAYFEHTVDAIVASLVPRMVAYDNADAAVADVRAGKLAAYVNDLPVVQFMAQTPSDAGACDLSVAGEVFGPGALVLGLPKGSPFTDALTRALLKLTESGLTASLKRTWFIERAECANAAASSAADSTSLGLTQTKSTFILLAAGAGIATVWAVVEILYFRFVYGRRRGTAGRLHRSMRHARALVDGSVVLKAARRRSGAGGAAAPLPPALRSLSSESDGGGRGGDLPNIRSALAGARRAAADASNASAGGGGGGGGAVELTVGVSDGGGGNGSNADGPAAAVQVLPVSTHTNKDSAV